MKSRKQTLEEMLAEEPNDAFLRYGLAMEFVSEGKDAEAVGQFRQLLAATPEYVPAYQQAGQALLRLNQRQEADKVLRHGIEAARQQGNAHAAEEMLGLLANIET